MRSRPARRECAGIQGRRAAISIAVAGVLGLVAAVAASAVAPRTALADHDGWHGDCPDPIEEGNSASFGVDRSGHEVQAVAVFTYNDSHSGAHIAGADDFTEYHGVRFEPSEDDIVWVPIETAEDTQPEHDEAFIVGFWEEGAWYGCEVTIIDDDEPRIVGVELASDPVDGWAYRDGEDIDVVVILDKKAEVDGAPSLSLYLGESGSSTWRAATYHSGSGTRELIFRYAVQPEDLDLDGIAVSAAATSNDGTPAYGFSGAINAPGTDVPIDYTHSGIDTMVDHRVDGRPYVQAARIVSEPEAGMGTYRANEIIEVAFTFDTRVVVEGDVCAHLFLGLRGKDTLSAKRRAAYSSGSGTDTLTFSYTVGPTDKDHRGIMIAPVNDRFSPCSSGTIKAEGTGVAHNPYYEGTGHHRGHKVDTRSPDTTSVTITSRPANGEAYTTGETITVEVAFDEPVAANGTPYLELHIGEQTRRATPVADQTLSTTLTFEYEVQTGDTDNDGIGIGANSIRHSNGSIHDRAGNNADLSHPTVPADTHQQISTPTAGQARGVPSG